MRDGLLIDARSLLDYEKIARETYASVGVPEKEVRAETFVAWLPQVLGDWNEALQLQAARDARFAEQLFEPKLRELAMLDVAYAFMDRGGHLAVYSFETAEALEALVARASLVAEQFPLCSVGKGGLDVLVQLELEQVDWLVVVTTGLTPLSVSVIENILGERGRIFNLPSPRRSGDQADRVLKLLEERWRNA